MLRNRPPSGRTTIDAFPVEYAEVYGVPFSLSPAAAVPSTQSPAPSPRTSALPERAADCEITFPRIDGYRYELPAERLRRILRAD